MIRPLKTVDGRAFYGHGVFSTDGSVLFSTEDVLATKSGLVSIWDGTTLFGVSHLYDLATQLGLDPLINGALDPACGSCREFLHGSAFLANLHSGNGVFQPGVEYTNILTRYDEAVTPYTSGLGSGPNVHNIVLQDSCPLDFSEHGGLAADRNAAGHVLNALDPADATPVPCHPASALGS